MSVFCSGLIVRMAGRLVFLPVVLFSVLFSVLLPLAGHGQNGTRDALTFLRIGSEPPSSAVYELSSAIAGSISAPPTQSALCPRQVVCGVPGLVAVAQSRPGTISNLNNIASGRLESALVFADASRAFFQESLGVQIRGEAQSLRLLAPLAQLHLHIVVKRSSPIRSPYDLRGRAVALGASGSALPIIVDTLLLAYDMDNFSIIPVQEDFADASESFVNGNLDALVIIGPPPTSEILELAARVPVRLLGFAGEERRRFLVEQGQSYRPAEIPAAAYPFLSRNIPTVSILVFWLVHKDVEDRLVYRITRSLWHEGTIESIRSLSPNTELPVPDGRSLRGAVPPLHPGAERYYRQAGLLE